MKEDIYKFALGCVASYKTFYEPMLFNELNTKCTGIKLIDRGDSSAAFAVPDYTKIVSEVHNNGFIFLQHIHPFMVQEKINGDASDFGVYAGMLEAIIAHISKDDNVICQCRIDSSYIMDYSNRELTSLLGSTLENKGYSVSPSNATIAISLTIFRNTAFMGISYIEDNLSDWTGGVLFYSKTNDIICRAEFKIEEAFKVFGIKISGGMKALDLGAAPGGWTHYLSKQGIQVDAVDPADLENSVLKSPGVVHYKMLAQQFVEENQGKCYDIMVNDMKMDTNKSVEITCEMSKQLKKDGICLLTLKLPKSNIQKRINSAKIMLSKKFEIIQIRQLYYNRSEVTICARNKK